MRDYLSIAAVIVAVLTTLSKPVNGAPLGEAHENTISTISKAYQDRQYQEVFELASKALDQSLSDEEESLLYYYMGISKRHQNEFSEAFQLYEKALELTDDVDTQTKLLLCMGAVLHHCNQFTQAIEIYNRAEDINNPGWLMRKVRSILLFPEISGKWMHSVYFNRSLSRRSQGDYKGAIDDIFRSLAVCEEKKYLHQEARLFNQMGNIEMENKNYGQAREYFFKALNIDTDSSYSGVAWHNIARADLALGDTTAAIANYKKAIPLHKSADQLFLTYYDLSQIEAGGLSPLRAGGYFTLADSLYRHGGVTLNKGVIEAYFHGSDIGFLDAHDLKLVVMSYLEDQEKVIDQYKEYAGALMISQLAKQKQVYRQQVTIIAITIISILFLAAAAYWYRNRKKFISSEISEIKNELLQ